MMRWCNFIFLCIFFVIGTANGESEIGTVNGNATDATVHFSNKTDLSYSITAQPSGGWVFTDDFSWGGPNGWYSDAKYSIACERIPLVDTAFVDASLCFGASMNGKMYIPGGEGGNPIPWSVKSAFNVAPTPYIYPAESIWAKGNPETLRYVVDNVMTNTPGGFWKYYTFRIPVPGVSYGTWINAGASYTLPANLEPSIYTVNAARNNAGAFQASATVTVVGVKKLSVTQGTTTITSTTDTPGDDESVCIDMKRTGITALDLKITATPEPGSAWPDKQPEWYVDNIKMQTGKSSYSFSAEGKSIGKHVVETRCGSSKKAMNVYIIQSDFILINDSPGNAPLVFQYSATTATPTSPSVGHTAWQIRVIPEAAHNILPFSEYKNQLNKFVGFHANSNAVIFSGRVNAPKPSFHQPDAITGQIKSYAIDISKAKQGLMNIKNKTMQNGGGNYILGTACTIDCGYPIAWTHESDRNCTVTASEAGSALELTIPDSMVFWRGTVVGISVTFSGHSPFGLGNNL